MHRKFIAIVLGAALAVTGLSSAPVRAQDRGETAAIIAGVAALAIIGAAVASDRKKDRRNDYVARGHGHNYQHQNRYYNQKRHYKQKRHIKQKRYYRQERQQQRHTNNRGYRTQPTYNNRGHQTRQYNQRRVDRNSMQSRYNRHQAGR